MKRMCLAALTGALAISTMALAIDDASAAYRGGVHRVGVNRVGVNRVGVNRVGVGRVGIGYGRAGIGYGRAGIGYGRAALAYRGGWNGYYGRRLGVATGVALGTAAAYYGGSGYYGDSGYGAYASANYDASGGSTYALHGTYMDESDAVAYCAQHFRSYDVESRTFVAYSGQRVSCPQ
jgi:hypothetical protein